VDAGSVDGRADLYSLGVMFFMLLAGRLPKPGERLTDVVPGLPRECDAFVEQAIAPSPDDRFPTAHEFRLALMDAYPASRSEAEAPSPQRRQALSKAPPNGRMRALLSGLARLVFGRRSPREEAGIRH